MKELGEYLQETRNNHGVSLEEAAEDLNMTTSQLENIESGNTRAFQDMYTLKEYVKDYAKYLGLDPEKVLDEFNDFLFEHTSKISLNDILEAEAKKKEKAEPQKKAVSPYTKIKKKKDINFAPIVLLVLIVLFVVFLIYLLLRTTEKAPTIDTELMGRKIVEEERI